MFDIGFVFLVILHANVGPIKIIIIIERICTFMFIRWTDTDICKMLIHLVVLTIIMNAFSTNKSHYFANKYAQRPNVLRFCNSIQSISMLSLYITHNYSE